MNTIILRAAAIDWLQQQSREYVTRPLEFTPKQIADAVGGAYTALGGATADFVASELSERGIKTQYLIIGNRRIFKILQ